MTVVFTKRHAKTKTIGSKFTIVKMAPGIKYHMSLSSNDESLGTTVGSGTYIGGSIVQIKAIPSIGCKFLHWSDGSIDAQREITVDSDISLVAYFEKDASAGVLEYVSRIGVYSE